MRILTYYIWRLFRFPSAAPLLDWGAGDGLFVRLMRDVGINAFYFDPLATNTYALGFEADMDRSYEMITAFEVMEHLVFPGDDLKRIFDRGPSALLGSTSLYVAQGPEWSYLNPLTGRHVFFYSTRTLRWVAKSFGYEIIVGRNKFFLFYRAQTTRWQRYWLNTLLSGAHSRIIQALFAVRKKNGLLERDRIFVRDKVGAALR